MPTDPPLVDPKMTCSESYARKQVPFRNDLTPRHPEVGNFTRCNSTDIDSYARMPTDPSWLTPKTKYSVSYARKQGPFGNELMPREILSFHSEMGRYVCWKKRNITLVGETENVASKSGKKKGSCTLLIT